MINNRANEKVIREGLKDWFKRMMSREDIEIVRQNQTAEIPPYPYITHSIISEIAEDLGTYMLDKDQKWYKPVTQTWSVSVISKTTDESRDIAMMARDFLTRAGNTYLSDNDIIVVNATGISNRDNLVTIEYERKEGFDVTLSLTNHIDVTPADMSGWIETIDLKNP